jgi:hypothetical protein
MARFPRRIGTGRVVSFAFDETLNDCDGIDFSGL